MDSINITNARKDLFKIVQQVRESHRPIQITGKNGAAVLVSDEDWNNIEATLALTAIPGMRESILEGMQTPLDECSDAIEW
ncbi:MAG: type II toxin-antitoxin system Phd/YefM family antitoxin [Spirochaetaceae bacterium]|nr:MAG: type II toxin-antitoxin system Phd/YefM family antitoxin [Spirochaetaceae bacterium]